MTPSIRAGAGEAAEACASHVLALLDATLVLAPFATFAISGGSTPRLMFERLAESRFRWELVHLFWVDERSVPPADEASNYRLAYEHLIGPAHIPDANIHRIVGEMETRQAAAQYETEIRRFFHLADADLPSFDVVHRGIGPDCHTASLFPGNPLTENRDGIAAAVYAPQFSQWRVTLLPGVLLRAGNTVMLAAGADKAEAVRNVFHKPLNPLQYPAQLGAQQASWFMDSAAASLL